ncbi:MAG: hypothetical protein ACAH80_04405 [Alphaproteobacteria bacterium]
MKNFRFAMTVVAGLALCGPAIFVPGADALAQGYKLAEPQSDGYGTIMPPSKKKNSADEPQGYRGVIPGKIGDEPQTGDPATDPVSDEPDEEVEDAVKKPVGKQPAATQQQQKPRVSTPRARERITYQPGKGPRTPMLSADQMALIAKLTGMKFDLKQLPENMRESIKINPKVYSLVSSPATRIDGMLPTEYGAKRMIDVNRYMIEQSNFTPERKKEALIDLMIRLRQHADALRLRQNVPIELYAQMGVPAIYVQEEKEGVNKGIQRLDAAIKQIYEEQKQL